MTDGGLHGRRIVVTGGLGALGRRVAAELARRGARVVAIDRAPAAEMAGVQRVLGGVDLADSGAAAVAFAQAAKELDGLDGLVNVAGGFAWEKLEGGALETWDRLYAMNVRSAVAACQAALPHLAGQPGAAIVNVGALAAVKAAAGMGAYAASKSAVARLTEALAEELKDRVRVNAVLPSIIDTPANRKEMPDADASRWVSPDALAAVIAFLLSAEAEAVTGALLPVAGRV